MHRCNLAAILAIVGGIALVRCTCSSEPEPIALLEVQPVRGSSDQATPITIVGSGFYPLVVIDYQAGQQSVVDLNFAAWLGPHALEQALFVDSHHLTAIVPAGLPAGTYPLLAVSPQGQRVQLNGAFTVTATAVADGGSADAFGTDRPGQDAIDRDARRPDVVPDRPGSDLLLDRTIRDGAADTAVSTDGTTTTDTTVADAARPDTAQPDTTQPDTTATPDSSLPDSWAPDLAQPDATRPDTAVADSGPAWWDGDWSRRRRITFDNRAQSEALDHFPVLIVLDASTIDYAATQDQGQDLRFVDDDGATLLPHEIERFDEAGTSFVWVAVGRIDAASDADFIWLYYGNAAAGAGQNAAAVWSSGYRGVWHLQQSPTGAGDEMLDSTLSGKHGTPLNMAAGDSTTGPIDRGLDLDGSSEVVRIESSAASGDALDIVGGPLTLEGWASFRTGAGTIIAKRNVDTAQWQLQTEDFGQGGCSPSLIWSDSGDQQHVWYSPQTISLGRWTHVAVTVGSNGVPVRFYLDGQPSAPIQDAHDADPPVHWGFDVAIGARWAGPPSIAWALDGLIDEVRVSAAIRSDGWLAASYASMTGSFVRVGSEERR